MTNLSLLSVSLTKHNAHKIAPLLKKYPANQILGHLDEVSAEEAQARKNLSIQPGDVVPEVWAKAKKLGDDAVDALVLAGIIFSHHSLIEAMQEATDPGRFTGRIERDEQLAGKAYTNFVRIIDQLGYATKLDSEGVTYSLRPMFDVPGLGPVVRELLELKLRRAGWDRSNSFESEIEALEFHKVFGISAAELKTWLSQSAAPAPAPPILLPKDQEFFQAEDEGAAVKPFEFVPGHVERAVEPVSKAPTPRTKANRLHNDIQNRLYTHLAAIHGAKNVGTEIDTGSGTAIDLVTNIEDELTFYEIKTSSSVRASIRQAIPQLLEYAYWPNVEKSKRLIIVSHLPPTKASTQYLEHLRQKFGLPITYQQFDLKTNKLV